MAKKPAKDGILATIRAEIARRENDGTNLHEMANGADVDYGQLYRFARGTKEPGIKTAEKLASYLGLRLRRE